MKLSNFVSLGKRFGVSAFISALAVYFGEIFAPIIVLIVLMIIDYISGMISAWIRNELSSKTGLKGIAKKVSYIFLIAAASGADYLVRMGLATVSSDIAVDYSLGFALLTVVWLIINEIISILENISKAGVPVPGFLQNIMDKLLIQSK